MHLHFQNEIQNKQYQLVVRLGPSCPIDLENNSESRNGMLFTKKFVFSASPAHEINRSRHTMNVRTYTYVLVKSSRLFKQKLLSIY